jgi:hypothetical protein
MFVPLSGPIDAKYFIFKHLLGATMSPNLFYYTIRKLSNTPFNLNGAANKQCQGDGIFFTACARTEAPDCWRAAVPARDPISIILPA